mmetsp:Transcript_202/g.764  ORF Transcript_202/g.764 Transcript_202/m.764 type:complete len:238 (+) Transcript_202:1679-2392(+)
MVLEFDDQLHVAVFTERGLVAVVEFDDVLAEQVHDGLEAGIHGRDRVVLKSRADEVREAVVRNRVTIGVAVLEHGLHARSELALDARHDGDGFRLLREAPDERVKGTVDGVGRGVQRLEAVDVGLVDELCGERRPVSEVAREEEAQLRIQRVVRRPFEQRRRRGGETVQLRLAAERRKRRRVRELLRGLRLDGRRSHGNGLHAVSCVVLRAARHHRGHHGRRLCTSGRRRALELKDG